MVLNYSIDGLNLVLTVSVAGSIRAVYQIQNTKQAKGLLRALAVREFGFIN